MPLKADTLGKAASKDSIPQELVLPAGRLMVCWLSRLAEAVHQQIGIDPDQGRFWPFQSR